MRALLLLLALFSAAALAQAPEQQKKDAETRTRVDGAAGGTGNPVAKGEGKRDAVQGKPNRRDQRPKQAKEGRVHDEQSSQREEARGAR